MCIRGTIAVLFIGVTLLAQTESASCPADRPVDDLIAEVHKQQSKKNNRNTNPFPDVGCIWGWCREHSKTPPTIPEPAPQAQIPDNRKNDSGTSSSSNPQNDCNNAMERALDAAHSVDVGDFNLNEKNYRGALMRYQDALENKPNDGAIEVRLGRAYEKLNQSSQAIEAYAAAQKLPAPQKWLDEARSALQRLQK
ncbi:MAG: hypothetical protein C5B46_08910 [Proteobacteria bacterium]|nr:MAG: hypothetical protein C5B46_08910 [Pseudomonadota bacterium]